MREFLDSGQELRGTPSRSPTSRTSEVELPTLRKPTIEDERCRRLVFLNRLASDWGAKPAAGGKVVWFEVALSSDGEPAGPL